MASSRQGPIPDTSPAAMVHATPKISTPIAPSLAAQYGTVISGFFAVTFPSRESSSPVGSVSPNRTEPGHGPRRTGCASQPQPSSASTQASGGHVLKKIGLLPRGQTLSQASWSGKRRAGSQVTRPILQPMSRSKVSSLAPGNHTSMGRVITAVDSSRT